MTVLTNSCRLDQVRGMSCQIRCYIDHERRMIKHYPVSVPSGTPVTNEGL